MTHFRHTFMGINGFEDLKRYTRSGTDFGREVVAVLSERIQLEQMYSKSLRRLGQRISKASCLIITSPLSNAWNTVGLEMEKEAEIHREFCGELLEKCIKPLSTLTESQLKPRKMVEQRVEGSYRAWSEKYTEHVKLKKRLHVQRRENEMLIEQIDGPRMKNDKDHQKLVTKQLKNEDTCQRTDTEYYNSLMVLERARQEWELNSFQCCDSIENMEDDRYREVCHIIKQYSDVMYDIPSKMKSCCRIIDDAVDTVSPSKEISVVAEKCRGAEYLSEQLLCDYYQENFNFPMVVGRRKHSLSKLLERYINDYQKENCHRDGLKRLGEAALTNDLDIQSRLMQSTAMLTYLDVIRFKLNRTLATIDGSSSKPSHVYEKNVEENVDKQGIKFSILKTRPGEDLDRLKEKNKKKSKGSSSSSSKPHRTPSNDSQENHHSKAKYYNTVSAGTNIFNESRRPPPSSSSSSRSRQTNATVRMSVAPNFALPPPTNEKRRNSSKPTPPPSASDSPLVVAPTAIVAPPPHVDEDESPPSYENIDKDTALSSSTATTTEVVLCQCVAIYNYEGTRDDELTIYEHDVIQVFEKGEDQWWRGCRVDGSGKTGLFPANYVEIVNTI